jgi:hypothetical protein
LVREGLEKADDVLQPGILGTEHLVRVDEDGSIGATVGQRIVL